MRIGYCCKLIGVPNTDMKSCTLKNANNDKLTQLISHNINSLNKSIDYNIKNNIQLFRISSDLIPFGSSEVNRIKWWEIFSEEINAIGKKIKKHNMRVSVHPGQYTVLNSNNIDIVRRAIDDLAYHTRILDSLGMNSEHKVVLHIGGAYDDKGLSIERFIEKYKLLPDNIKSRLVIENDDRIYNIEEVLDIGLKLNIPVIFDNLHNQINPAKRKASESYWIDQCRETWKEKDGNQKIHYSQQDDKKRIGSHSNSISIDQFLRFYKALERDNIDIMLEVKDKNLSCIKCMNCTFEELDIEVLQREWNKFKYTILERSYPIYDKINELLDDKDASAIHFYKLIETGLKDEGDFFTVENAALHVWSNFKSYVTEREKDIFFKYLKNYQNQKTGINSVKNYLKKIAEKYRQNNLLSSLYFYM